MFQIEINNTQIHITGHVPILNKVYESMKVKHPNGWFLRSHMPKGWDGKIEFLSKTGKASTGLLPMVVD